MEDEMALEFPDSTTESPEDSENPQERAEFDIEQALRDFVDEPPIRHDVFPEVDSDDEEEIQRKFKKKHEIKRGDGILYEGQVFTNGVAFKEAVLDYVMSTGVNLKQHKYDPVKIGIRCIGGHKNPCPWRIYCSLDKKIGMWRVKIFESKHSCIPNGACAIFRTPVIARVFLDKIRADADYFMPMKMEEIIKTEWTITVSRGQCQQARYKALDWIEKEYAAQFASIRNYKGEILESNPNSSVEIECLTNEEGLDVFHRFYVCFDNLRRSWKESCRPLLGVDGSFMRANMQGQVLVALGRDADNAIYPVVWAVVPAENFDNWEWFMKKIQVDLELGDGYGFIMMSDRQKGLIKAVKLILPQMEHRMCVKHIYGNLKSKFGKRDDMKWLIWQLAWSYNEPEYKVRLARIAIFDSAVHAWVLKSKPETWVRAFQKIREHCVEDVENNSTESFNRTICKAREKPLVPMLETIASLAMARIARRDVEACVWTGTCTPYVGDYLVVLHKEASLCTVTRSTNNTYGVDLHGCRYRVSLGNRTCTCMRFQITGIPCEHAYGVILDRKLEAEDYVSHWFRTTKWRKTYEEGIIPLRGYKFWPDRGEGKVVPNPDLMMEKKDKKRKKGRNESPTKKAPTNVKRVMTCSVCFKTGHNCRKHKEKETAAKGSGPSQGPQAQSSQAPEASQGSFTQPSQGSVTQL